MELTPLEAPQAICNFVDIPSTYKKFEDPYQNAKIAIFKDENKFGVTVQKFKENLYPDIEKQLNIWEEAHNDEISDVDVDYLIGICKVEADRRCLSIGNMVRDLFFRSAFPFPIKFGVPWTVTIGGKTTTFEIVENEFLKDYKKTNDEIFAENARKLADPLHQIDWLYEYEAEMRELGYAKEIPLDEHWRYKNILPFFIDFSDTTMVIEK